MWKPNSSDKWAATYCDTPGRETIFEVLNKPQGVPIEKIARLIGHAGGSAVTETVYRKQLRPVIEDGATVMDRVFAPPAHRQRANRTPSRRTGGPEL